MKQADLVGELTSKLGHAEQKIDILQERLDQALHQIDLLTKALYAPKSERFTGADTPGQMTLELPAEQPAEAPAEPAKETITYERKKKKRAGRQPLPEHLPRVQRIIEPDHDTTGMVRIGQEVTELLAKKPSSCSSSGINMPSLAGTHRWRASWPLPWKCPWTISPGWTILCSSTIRR